MWWTMSGARRYAPVARLRRPLMAFVLVVGLITGAGIASAADEEGEEDTLLNFGYDADNHIFLVNTSATDSAYDCTLENGTLTAHYGAADEGRVSVDMLLEEDKAVLFANRPEEEVGADFTAVTEPVAYTGADGECAISGGVVGGPNGQINHGQFMKLFHQLTDKQGMGCLNRIIAQSNLGKGDQQIRTSDVDLTFTSGSTGQVDFNTVAAHCESDSKGNGNHDQGATEQGNKDKNGKSGRPDSPGNSSNAPGHNK